MHKTILHIGSNVGNPEANLVACIALLREKIGLVVSESSVYKTEPWGVTEQGDFYNQALTILTELSVLEVLSECKEIETILGRQEKIKWGPRVIDIDIIFFDDLIYENDDIQIPHARMHERNFVLFPLAEIVPEWEHPILSKSVQKLKETSMDQQKILEKI